MIEYKIGNIFNCDTQTIVNPINCVGAMGKGAALEFRILFPNMYRMYKELCTKGLLEPGKLWIYRNSNLWDNILNFPTKVHWKDPSKIEYIEKGLRKFVNTFEEKGITSISFPMLGCDNGGLQKREVIQLFDTIIGPVTNKIRVEVWDYSKNSLDSRWETIKSFWLEKELSDLFIDCNNFSDLKKKVGSNRKLLTYIVEPFKTEK